MGCKQRRAAIPQPVEERVVDEPQAVASFLKERDEETFCVLFKAVYGRVLRYFLLRGTDEMTAEELAQNVLLAVYRRPGEFQDHPSFRSWLFVVARNELLQDWRRKRARIQTVELDPLRDGLVENKFAAGGMQLRLEFEEWLGALEPADRDLAHLRFVEGLSHEELSAVFEAPVGTIKSRLFHLKRKLYRTAGLEAQNK